MAIVLVHNNEISDPASRVRSEGDKDGSRAMCNTRGQRWLEISPGSFRGEEGRAARGSSSRGYLEECGAAIKADMGW